MQFLTIHIKLKKRYYTKTRKMNLLECMQHTKRKEGTIYNSLYINNNLVNKFNYILPKINLSKMDDIKSSIEKLKY